MTVETLCQCGHQAREHDSFGYWGQCEHEDCECVSFVPAGEGAARGKDLGASQSSASSTEHRCSPRKHFVQGYLCDCGAVTMGSTAAGNAYIVTVLDRDKLPRLVSVPADPERESEAFSEASALEAGNRWQQSLKESSRG